VSRRTLLLVATGAGLCLAPLVGMAVPDTVRIPMARAHPEGTPQAAALFSHWAHEQYRCFACHPSVFPQAAKAFVHADMNAGRFCANCHGGGKAPAVYTYPCERCHVPR
jgi:c(7)-type cytochrome triheme protein